MTGFRELEELAGTNLYDFTLGGGAADGPLLRRWAPYFATKLWFINRRTEALADGPLRSILSTLADPGARVLLPVRLARIDASPRRWHYAALAAEGWAGDPDPYIAWVIRGVIWMVVLGGPRGTLPIRTIELTDGLRLSKVPLVRRRDLVRLLSAPPADLTKLTAEWRSGRSR